MEPSRKRPRIDDGAEAALSNPLSNPPPHRAEPNKPVSSSDLNSVTRFGRFVQENIVPNEYQHETLSRQSGDNQIRLLILRKGSGEEMLRCAFHVAPLSQASNYEALSYYWGTKSPDKQIFIEKVQWEKRKSRSAREAVRRAIGQVIGQKFHIRPNLYAALSQLRDKERDIVLWVDALCINQEDEEEKSRQVEMMASIYSRAHRVLVWLGAGNVKCIEALGFIREILNLASFEALIKDEKSAPKWAALVELMRCEWFSRRWVVQELALAHDATLHYGSDHVNWKDFADAVAIFATRFDSIKQLFLPSREFNYNVEYLGDVEALGANILVDVTANHFRRLSGVQDHLERLSSLEALVSRLLKFEASDPRDTVYALLSICKEKSGIKGQRLIRSNTLPVPGSTTSEVKLIPDYKKSMIEVYRDFTEFCIATSRSIDIICRHWAPAGWSESATLDVRLSRMKTRKKPKVNAKMPSWIPLLSHSPFGAPRQVPPGRVNGDSLVGHPDRKCYNACGGMYTSVRFENNPLDKGRTVSQPQSQRPPVDRTRSPEQMQGREAGALARSIPNDIISDSPIRYVSSSPSNSSTYSNESGHSIKSEPVRDQDPERPPMNAFFMIVTGILLDTVTEVTSRIPPGLLTKECLKMGGWNGPKDQNEIPDELWRTLVADRAPDGGNPPGWYHRACWECFQRGNSSGDVNMSTLITMGNTPSLMVEFLKRVQGIVWNRLFVRSRKRKLFGLGPQGTQVNDLICILYGCSVPVILRPQQDPESHEIKHYEIVGEAYIYGMMDGEAITEVLPEVEPQEFKLG